MVATCLTAKCAERRLCLFMQYALLLRDTVVESYTWQNKITFVLSFEEQQCFNAAAKEKGAVCGGDRYAD